MDVRNDASASIDEELDPLDPDALDTNAVPDGKTADGDAPPNGIGEDGTYRWRGEDGSRLTFGRDGSFALTDGNGSEGTESAAPESGTADGDGGVDFPGDLSSLDPADVAETARQVREAEGSAGDGVKFDGDGDGVEDDRIYADPFGSLTVVESEGTIETIDVNGNHGFRDAEGNVFQGNADGTFVHRRADGTATWRTADETGETTLDEDGSPTSTRTDHEGNREATDGPPSGLLTLPGLREDGLMALVDEAMQDGFLSDGELTLIAALADSGVGG